MKCPFCSSENTKVVDSRPQRNGRLRRRICSSCHKRFSTTETYGVITESPPLLAPQVKKKSGLIQKFNAVKLRNSIAVAVRKSRRDNVPIDKIVEELEEEAALQGSAIETRAIGETVLRRIRQYDMMAFLRYASVHMEMNSPDDYTAMLGEISKAIKKK